MDSFESTSEQQLAYRLSLITGSLIILILQSISNWHGLTLTTDSYYYLELASSIKAQQSLTKVNPYFPFQTLLPYLIYWLDKVDVNLISIVYILSPIFIYLINMKVGRELFKSKYTLIFYSVSLVFSTPLYLVHSFLWTEPLFILCLSAMWLCVFKYMKKQSKFMILPIMVLAILLCLSRKAGILFIGFGSFFVLLFSSVKWKFFRPLLAIVFIIFALFFYGYLGETNYIGERPTTSGFLIHFEGYTNSLSTFLLPRVVPYGPRVVAFTAALIYALTVIVSGQLDSFKRRFLYTSSSVVALYFLTRLFYFRPDVSEMDRYLSPVYPILFAIIAMGIDGLTRLPIKKFHILKIIVLLWFLYPITRTIKNIALWSQLPTKKLVVKKEASY